MPTGEFYTLITGGSSGIGKALAMECASRKMNLIIVALPGLELEQTANEIRNRYKVKVRCLEMDLTNREAPLLVYKWCEQLGYTVNMLINNAGLAGTAIFDESSLLYSDSRIQLNIRALVLLCRVFLPDMKKLPKAYILNTGSMSAFYNIPYKSLYSASKAFVVNFTRSLKEELKGSPVSISVVCPNGVHTNKGTKARIESHGYKGKMVELPPDAVAKIAIDGLLKGKTLIIPGAINKIIHLTGKLIPYQLKQYFLLKEFKKEVNNV